MLKPINVRKDFDASSTELKKGDFHPEHGYYIGRGCFEGYSADTPLGQEFNFFAAKGGKLKGRMSFYQSLKVVASLRNYFGNDGAEFTNEKEAIEVIKQGKWALPTREMLLPIKHLGEKSTVMPEGSIGDIHSTGAVRFASSMLPAEYNTFWSSTKACSRGCDNEMVFNLDLTSFGTWVLGKSERYSALVVRGVPRAPKV